MAKYGRVWSSVIASINEAIQKKSEMTGLPRRFTPRKDESLFLISKCFDYRFE